LLISGGGIHQTWRQEEAGFPKCFMFLKITEKMLLKFNFNIKLKLLQEVNSLRGTESQNVDSSVAQHFALKHVDK